jgi:hypothetical protein
LKLPFGNKPAAILLILLFITIWALTLTKCSAQEAEPSIYLGAGSSITHGAGAEMLEADLHLPLPFKGQDAPSYDIGTTLLGPQNGNPNNWAWYAQLEGSRGRFNAGLGFAYLARADGLNGEHANYTLTMAWELTDRIEIRYRHFSDAGTSPINEGRDMLIISWRLQ